MVSSFTIHLLMFVGYAACMSGYGLKLKVLDWILYWMASNGIGVVL